jgi:hypothetical protein
LIDMSLDQFLLSADTTYLNYPEIRPTLDLNFARTKTLDPRITFTRASSGSYFGADGLIKYAGVNEARFDHNPLTGESLGLLVEEQRTNLLLQSNAFTTTWQAGANTLTSASAVSPDGTTNGWRFADTAANSTHIIFQPIAWTAVATTFTVYAKYDTHRWIGARIGNTGNQFFGSWDLQNGVVGSFTAGATIGMQAVGNGWYRLTLTATLTSAGLANVLLYLNNADSASALTYAGTSTGSYIYGAQLEVGAFATSYIPTTTAAATRNADVARITGTNFSSWYRQDEGTFYFSAKRDYPVPSGPIPRIYQVQGAIATDKIEQDFYSGGQVNFVRIPAGIQAEWYPAYFAQNGVASSLALATNNIAGSSNGVITRTDNVATLPTVTQMFIGCEAAGANVLNGHIRRLTYWPKRLPNAQLRALTR